VDALESLLTVREVATYLACAEETVKRLVRRGELPATRIGTRLRFARADVETYQAAHSAQPSARRVRAQVGKRLTAYPRLPVQSPTSAAAYLTQLQLVTGVFTQLHTPSQAAELVLRQCVRALDASSGLLSLVREGPVLDLVHAIGYRSRALDQWRRLALDAPLPLPDVVRRGEPRFFETLTALHAHYPQLADVPTTSAAWAMIPLPIDDQVIGGIVLAFAKPRTFSMDDRAFLLALAQQCAQAIERARLYALEVERRSAAERAVERTAILQNITAELSHLHTQEQIADIAMTQGMRALGATAGALSLLNDDDTFAIVRMIGYSPSVVDTWVGQRYSAGIQAPIPDAVRTRAPIWLESTDAILARYPHLAAQLMDAQQGAWATIPLAVQDRVFGGVTFLFAEPRTFTPADRGLLLALAQQCAQAIDRARLHAAEQAARAEVEAARERLAMLAGASMELALSLDVQRTLETLARLVVPRLADWCVVDMLMDDGTIQTLVVTHADPAREAIGWDMVRRYAIDPESPGGTAAVLRTLQYELVPEIPDTMLAILARDEEHLRMLRAMGLRSSLCVPLVARGRALGTIALVAAESGRRYGEADLPFVEDLARRAALAVDNARLYREAQAAIGLRDTFFSIAAHELRTPLTSLLGQAQLIQRRARREGDLGERYQQSLRVIEHQATRLNTMILAMLDTARLEQGRLRLEWQPVNLHDLIERVVEEIQPTLDRHIITLIAEDGPLMVIGDMLRLEQVAQNLIGNAVKYSPRGGPVGVRLRRVGDRAQIVVRDEGIGIPPVAIPQMFQRFYRASNVDAQHISGMGIGLYVVKEIVALHGGTVAVESVEQQGSTFSVSLPLAEAA